jgi:hypothetical protein
LNTPLSPATTTGAVGPVFWLELTARANWAHRVLGAAGLVFVVAMVGQAVGA